MRKYKNVSGKSGVSSYETGSDYILIRFANDSSTYLYNYTNPGQEKVEEMKVLAQNGKGLSTYISQIVRENYFAKL